jgi:hypothetical protein
MAKKGTKKQALGWIPSFFDDMDLKKAKKEGFLSESVEIIFPKDEAIPSPPTGFRVMFFYFLFRRFILSCPRIPSWASLCVRRAAASSHAKLFIAHCLLH